MSFLDINKIMVNLSQVNSYRSVLVEN